ncbi:MAG: PDZ domain-containing protein [Phycisphaeraceae bacterium]|nr:PDZ domain-containing protein [Phycisphaeraceae bacterium]MBX3367617.1 PDZ domain-containing protein [Phycisphaeraceae bacterium]
MKHLSRNTSILPALSALLLAVGTASPAAAQVTWTTQPSPPPAPAAASGGSTTRTIVSTNDDRTIVMSGTTASGDRYEIKLKNDTLDAKLNGKRVPDDRIRLSGSLVELLDEQGGVIVSMDTNPAMPVIPAVRAVPAIPPIAGGGQWTATPSTTFSIAQGEAQPPKVMVGINMSDVGATLREHFGLSEDAGFVVDGVIENLPASNAGIQARDIVIAIDGQNVTNTTLRQVLNTKEPGQKVKVRILRKGSEKNLDMVLEGYDASKLGIGPITAAGTASLSPTIIREFPTVDFYRRSGNSEEAQRALELAERSMEQAMSQLRGQQGAESMREASERMRQALEELRRSQSTLREGAVGQERLDRLFVVPSAPTPPATPSEPGAAQGRSSQRSFQVLRDPRAASPADADRMGQLESQINELNSRLDKLDDRIGRLLDRLERGN